MQQVGIMALPDNGDRGAGAVKETLRMTKVADLRREIATLEAQKGAKEQELRQLQDEPKLLLDFLGRSDVSSLVLRPEEKIALFLALFGARRDVYPRFWEDSSSGKKGYSPACATGNGQTRVWRALRSARRRQDSYGLRLDRTLPHVYAYLGAPHPTPRSMAQ